MSKKGKLKKKKSLLNHSLSTRKKSDVKAEYFCLGQENDGNEGESTGDRCIFPVKGILTIYFICVSLE